MILMILTWHIAVLYFSEIWNTELQMTIQKLEINYTFLHLEPLCSVIIINNHDSRQILQLGPGHCPVNSWAPDSGAHMSGAQLFWAQLSIFSKWTIGFGTQGPIVWGPYVWSPIIRGPICLESPNAWICFMLNYFCEMGGNPNVHVKRPKTRSGGF